MKAGLATDLNKVKVRACECFNHSRRVYVLHTEVTTKMPRSGLGSGCLPGVDAPNFVHQSILFKNLFLHLLL